LAFAGPRSLKQWTVVFSRVVPTERTIEPEGGEELGMESKMRVHLALLAAGFLWAASASAVPVTIGFEGLPDLTPVTAQYAGLTFSGATAITAGVSLNELEFPPKSGTSVVYDDGGQLSIGFAIPVVSAGGYFTYAMPLSLQAFDGAGDPVGTAASTFGNNGGFTGDAGSSPNEYLAIAAAGGISRLVITGDLAGASFTLDDFRYDTGLVPVSEPATVLFLVPGLSALALLRRRNVR
jgi:hypothetical protein